MQEAATKDAIETAMTFLEARGCLHFANWSTYLRQDDTPPYRPYCKDRVLWTLMATPSPLGLTAAELAAAMEADPCPAARAPANVSRDCCKTHSCFQNSSMGN